MSAWAIEVVTSAEPDPQNPATAREADVVAEVGTVLGEQADPVTLLPAEPESGAPERYRSLHRTAGEHPIAAVLDAVEARLADRSWYVVRYHRCRHDAAPGRPCEPW